MIGDAAIGGGMPKSAFAANSQAKVCAAALANFCRREPEAPQLINTCYSLVAPDYGISIAGVYEPRDWPARRRQGRRRCEPAGSSARRSASSRPISPKAGSRPSPKRCLVDHNAASLGGSWDMAVCLASWFPLDRSAAVARAPFTIAIVGDAIPAPLTGAKGDPARGRAIVVNRQVGLCLLCHTGPFPEERLQGNLSPDLTGRENVGRRDS